MTGLRVTIGVLGAAGLVSGLLIDPPAVLAPLFAFGVVAFAGQASRILAVVAALALVLLSAAPRLIRGGG